MKHISISLQHFHLVDSLRARVAFRVRHLVVAFLFLSRLSHLVYVSATKKVRVIIPFSLFWNPLASFLVLSDDVVMKIRWGRDEGPVRFASRCARNVVFAFVVGVVVYMRLTRLQLVANQQSRPQRPPGIIVITGGMGNIGRALTRQLVAEGWRVRVLDLPYLHHSEPLLHLPEAFSPPPNHSTSTNYEGFQYFEGDVRNVTHLRRLLTSGDDVIAGVVHLGGFTQATKCELSPQLCSDVNLDGTRNILDILQERSLSPWILYASSYEVYKCCW